MSVNARGLRSRDDGRRIRPARGRWRRGHHPARPATDERPERAGPGGAESGRGRGRRPLGRRRRRAVRRREGVRRRRRRQGDGRHGLHRDGRPLGRAAVGLHRDRPHPEAGRGCRDGLRARRWLRARAVRRLPGLRRGREARAARDPARGHPRRRRHAAAASTGRARPRPRTSSSRAASSAPRRRCGSGWSTGWSHRGTSTPRPARWPLGSWVGRPTRCARRRRRSTAAWRATSTPGWRSSGCSSPACSRRRTGGSG